MGELDYKDRQSLYELMKKAASDALDEKIQTLKLQMIPLAEDEEIQDIEKVHGLPKEYLPEDFEDLNI